MYVCSYAKVRIFYVHRIFLSMYVCIYVWMDGWIDVYRKCSYVHMFVTKLEFFCPCKRLI